MLTNHVFVQSWEHGEFNMMQVCNVLKFFERSGKRALVVLHKKHVDKGMENPNPDIRKVYYWR